MRALDILLAFFLMVVSVSAGEVTVGLDRVALLIPDQQDYAEYSSRIAIHFSLPDEVSNSEMIYAEFHVPLNFNNIRIIGDSLLEIRAFLITSDWNEDNTDWYNPWNDPGGDIDTVSSYSYTIMLGQNEDAYMDISKFIRSILEDGSDNYGLVLIPVKYDAPVFHVNENLENLIRDNARVRIVYR